MSRCIDLTGKHFNRLVVIERAGTEKFGEALWLCKCDCGNTKITSSSRLRKGKCMSCGCLQNDVAGQSTLKHGLFGTRIYHIWSGMIQRCTNPKNHKYKNYGARGITICDEWRNDFSVFCIWAMQNGYEDNLSIDRIDVNGNYEPSNCRWINAIEQDNNKTDNVYITIDGITKTRSEWSRINGIRPATAANRVFIGWNEIDAVTIPVGKRRKINDG